MAKIHVCDVCGRNNPVIVAKAKHSHSQFEISWSEKYEICLDCWKIIVDMGKKIAPYDKVSYAKGWEDAMHQENPPEAKSK